METSKFIISSILLIITYAFGFWLSFLGKPYNGVLFTIHKLTALAATILLIVVSYSWLKGINGSLLAIGLVVLGGGCLIALFISGALMSVDKMPYIPFLIIHRITLVLLPCAVGGLAYLLAKGRL